MIQVVLCDDHAMVRRGIRDTLIEALDIKITGEASNYLEVKEVLKNSPCDVCLLYTSDAADDM
jgi:two-component system invasion response regulator UvrY